ncbi:hypothetical protein GALL_515680 [mine drainage metagenome]|uniref:Uncharacterized protein n=1 Tax=mine drainage metagenome TaxID=410659 RepID=A0A1J5PH14_9ZZZZ
MGRPGGKIRTHPFAGQKRHQVGHHADRADTGAAAAVRNAEGLVQVEVADIAAKFSRCGQADQCVHVGPIDIDAPAMAVHQCAQVFDVGFEHAMRAGVGDHHGRQMGAVLFAFGLEVGHIDIAIGIASGDHDLHAGHGGASRVGAVRAARDQADVAVGLAAREVKGANRHHAGVFALAAGVGLQADPGVTGGLAQPVAQLAVEFGVTGTLPGRGKRVNGGKLGPGDRDHLAGGVELHGATAQRDHAAVQRQIKIAQAADVAQHAGFTVVAVEYRVAQIGATAQQGGGQQRGHAGLELSDFWHGLPGLGKEGPELLKIIACGGFIERDAQAGL